MNIKHIVKNRMKTDFFFKKYAISSWHSWGPEDYTQSIIYTAQVPKFFGLKQVHVTNYISHHYFLQEELNYRMVLDSQIKKLKQQVNNETRFTISIGRKPPNPKHLNKLNFEDICPWHLNLHNYHTVPKRCIQELWIEAVLYFWSSSTVLLFPPTSILCF